MSEMGRLIMALLAGVSLGTFFFGGLWWTIQRGIFSRQPALLFSGSLLVRTLVALAGFYFVSQGHGHRLLVCLLGFFLARIFVTWFSGIRTEKRTGIGEGGGL
ncbi:MAG: ATP synthase subunit I [Candidatus Acidiferrales bacterium]|jgi:F1F0 ATPase subunit 2